MTAALLAALLVQDPEPPGEPLPAVLAKAVPGVRLEATPVRRAVTRAAAANGAAVVFGRGVDPTAPASLDAADETVAGVLQRLAGQAGAAAVPVGGAVFVGPPEACAALLAEVAARRAELAPAPGVRRAPRERALAEQAFAWEDLTTPRALLDEVAARFGLSVENADAVPHDLWPAGRLPAADAPAALSAVLVPCGLTFAWTDDRTGVRVEPLPAGFDPPPAPPLTAFAAGVPERASVGEGGGVPLDRQRFTLKVEGETVRRVMGAVRGVRFDYDPRALAVGGGDLDARVTLDLKQADADTFLTALFAPASVAFEWEGTTVRLFPVP